MVIKWNTPVFGEKEKELVTKVLESGYVSEGPKTKELEEKLAKIVGTKHVIMTTSCTAALYLAIEADKRIREYNSGEVIIPDLTFVSTKNAVELAGLNPNIFDVSQKRYCLVRGIFPPARIIIPVNLLGRNAWDVFPTITTVICDNAGCLGSKVNNGLVGCYSLQANKLISCGQGGFCATDNDLYAYMIRRLKDFGRNKKEENGTSGFNFKFNDILASIVLGQLEKLEERKKLHIEQYLTYKKELQGYGSFIEFHDGEVPLWVEFFPKEKRNELIEFLKKNNVEVRIPWKPFKGLPNAKFYYKTCIWLPNGGGLSKNDQNEVINKIKEFYDGN